MQRSLLLFAVALACCGRSRVQISKEGPIVWPPEWVACSADHECMIVSLGCASETAVNRKHESLAREALDASGREHASPKAACGPSPHGTWDGEPALCKSGVCVLPRLL